jgi:hypothetical protein
VMEPVRGAAPDMPSARAASSAASVARKAAACAAR